MLIMTAQMHKWGHILDLTITKGLNISKVSVTDVALSDHFSVIFESIICNDSVSQRNVMGKHIFKDSAAETFKQMYSSTSTLPCNTLDELILKFWTSLIQLLQLK
ncbi:hypothetical protein AMECASPLE_008521 [Ameca splendens]|uniref:Uncharacterized protein n=1 Tax=Ameca splendens TaxID=208324 RepID=A0ABV0XD21_9TELE